VVVGMGGLYEGGAESVLNNRATLVWYNHSMGGFRGRRRSSWGGRCCPNPQGFLSKSPTADF
jgi:hypothetical protein